MSIHHAIIGLLEDDATIQPLVTSGSNYKVFVGMARQGENPPYIVCSTVSHDPQDTKSGVSELDFVRYQVEYYSETVSELITLAEAGRAALDRFSGTKDTQAITSIQFLTEFGPIPDWENELYLLAQDYNIQLPL